DVGLVEALGLHLETRQRSWRDSLDEAADPKLAMHCGRNAVSDVGRRLDDAAELVHLADPRQLDAILAHLVEAANDRLDGAREHVHPADGDHVIHAPGDAPRELHERAPACARTAHRLDAIPGAIADDRHPPAAEVGEDELTLAFVACLAGRIEDLDDELRLVDVDAVARGAREAVGADLRRAGVIEGLDPELFLDT